MRSTIKFFLALFALLLAAGALAGPGIPLNPAVRTELTDCASGGSAASTLVSNTTYLLRITDADTFLCFAASGSTCAAGGEKFPMGTVILFTPNGNSISVSCRSSSSTGDAIFTAAQ